MARTRTTKRSYDIIQGDVRLRKIGGPTPEIVKVRENGVVAYGEVTGHAHRIVGEATVFEAAADRLIVDVTGIAELVHDEHATVPAKVLTPGLYEVVGQREYSPEAIRRVSD